MADFTLRELQTQLPWTIHYHRDFRSSPMSHKDFGHALLHVFKAAGKLAAIVNSAEHEGSEFKPEDVDPYIADLVVCALRLANTTPGRTVDLQRAVEDRIEGKNATRLVHRNTAHRMLRPLVAWFDSLPSILQECLQAMTKVACGATTTPKDGATFKCKLPLGHAGNFHEDFDSGGEFLCSWKISQDESVDANGINLPGWHCSKCKTFNGAAKEWLTHCRHCDSPRVE